MDLSLLVLLLVLLAFWCDLLADAAPKGKSLADRLLDSMGEERLNSMSDFFGMYRRVVKYFVGFIVFVVGVLAIFFMIYTVLGGANVVHMVQDLFSGSYDGWKWNGTACNGDLDDQHVTTMWLARSRIGPTSFEHWKVYLAVGGKLLVTDLNKHGDSMNGAPAIVTCTAAEEQTIAAGPFISYASLNFMGGFRWMESVDAFKSTKPITMKTVRMAAHDHFKKHSQYQVWGDNCQFYASELLNNMGVEDFPQTQLLGEEWVKFILRVLMFIAILVILKHFLDMVDDDDVAKQTRRMFKEFATVTTRCLTSCFLCCSFMQLAAPSGLFLMIVVFFLCAGITFVPSVCLSVFEAARTEWKLKHPDADTMAPWDPQGVALMRDLPLPWNPEAVALLCSRQREHLKPGP